MKLCVLWLALLASAPVTFVPVAFAQNAPATDNSSSATLTPRIKIALGESKGIQGSMINVETDQAAHTVILEGIVRSSAQKALAEAIARHQAGTFQVQNRLKVVAEQSRTQPVVPSKFERTIHFLQLLAASQGRTDGTTFGQRKTRFPDVKRLLRFIASRGVTIVDVNENHGKPLDISRARLSGDLKRTGSSAFDSFAYVGYIFAMPYAQYSRLTYTPTKNGVIVEMPSGHRLTWQREGGRLQLRKLEYLRLEGD